MKKFNLISKSIGNKKKVVHSFQTDKFFSVGKTDYKSNVFINNKYIINKHFKFNIKTSNNIYNNIFYSYKKINDHKIKK